MLRDDWLATTPDPFPIFSGLVSFTYIHLGGEAFYVYYVLLLGIYGVALTEIVLGTLNLRSNGRAFWYVATLIALLHSSLVGRGGRMGPGWQTIRF